MKFYELLEQDVDTDFESFFSDDWAIAYVGPCHLSEVGRKKFADILDKEVKFIHAYLAQLVVENEEQDELAREFFFYAAGYCTIETYDMLFTDETCKQAISRDKLYLLCNKFQWFTAGDIDQYQKLFDKCEAGASLEELALIIWLCSSNATENEILHTLRTETYQH